MSATFAALVVSALTSVPPRPVQPDTRARFILDTTVSTRGSRVGDPVPMRVAAPFVLDGVAIEAGSLARGTVVDVVRPGRIRGRGSFAIQIVSVTRADGTPLRVSGTYFGVPPPPRYGPPDARVPILAGMAAGYGTAALVSKRSTSVETISRAGLVAGLSTGILIGVLKRGEDFGLPRGSDIDVRLTGVPLPN